MTHKTLIGGTAYNIIGGTSLIDGVQYSIIGGKTLVDGTEYNISFMPPIYAMYYLDGSLVFQVGDDSDNSKTLADSYTDFEDATTPPWNGCQENFTSVSFDTEIVPISMAYWFNNSLNLVSNISNFINLNIDNLIDMKNTYYNCINLTGSPVCGDKVTRMDNTYHNCRNLTGSPVCGNNVTDMRCTYYGCTNLTGSPVCGDKVTVMNSTYYNCRNLTGSPVCGNNVVNIKGAYYNCRNLTGSPVCGVKVTDMDGAYYNCTNLTGNAYFYSSVVANAQNCFGNRNTSNRLNIYVPTNSLTNTTVHYTNAYSLVGAEITWTDDGDCQYNTVYNIYIYPVDDVSAVRVSNGD